MKRNLWGNAPGKYNLRNQGVKAVEESLKKPGLGPASLVIGLEPGRNASIFAEQPDCETV